MWVARTGIIASGGGDSDAQAFITAAGITDITQKNAVIQLVLDLKAASLWSKMKAVYPFLGGTASSHKFNLKDSRDLDAAYRLLFVGGGTHSSDGYKGNGTTAYANTYLNPATALTQNDIHISWHSNLNVVGGVQAEIGQVSTSRVMGYAFNNAQTLWITRLNTTSNGSVSTANTIGFHQMSRTNGTNYIMQKNTSQTTISIASTTPTSQNIILLASTTATEFSQRNLQLVTIGNGLSATEMNALNTINTNYKTNLGR